MRYSLLNFVACPVGREELTCLTLEEVEAPLPHVRLSECGRVSQAGALVGPLPPGETTPLREALAAEACESAPPERNEGVRVRSGLLVAAGSGRWYPVREFVPELLPDHLRDLEGDRAWLDSVRGRLPEGVLRHLRPLDRPSAPAVDGGLSYKQAEMAIATKVDDPGFFGPGLIAPFNPHSRVHSAYLIKLLGLCLPLVDPDGTARAVLDSGSGYSWTTEWMGRLGIEAIGSDITRDYLERAIARCGPAAPHLVVADSENLPMRPGVLDAVLAFDAFHHIPDRRKALTEFHRALRPGGRVVLAEPNAAHEHAAVSREVMEKYGILEKGMDWKDVLEYLEGLPFEAPEEHFHLRVERSSLGRSIFPPRANAAFVSRHATVPWNVFSIRRPASA